MDEQIDIVESLQQQQAQLKRLLDSKIWISEAPKPTLDEMASQVAKIKSLIEEIEKVIQAQQEQRRK